MRALCHYAVKCFLVIPLCVLCFIGVEAAHGQPTYTIRGQVRRAGAPTGLTLAYVRSQNQRYFGALGPVPFEVALPSQFEYAPGIHSGLEIPGQEDGIADLGVSQYLYGGFLFFQGDGGGGFTPVPLPPQMDIAPHFEGGGYTPIDPLGDGSYQLLISDPGPGVYTVNSSTLQKYEYLQGRAALFKGPQSTEISPFSGGRGGKVADLNRDGRNDIVSVQNPSFVYTNPTGSWPTLRFFYTLGIRHANPDGLSFSSSVTDALSPVFVHPTHEMMQALTGLADGDNDGYPDLVLAYDNPGVNNSWNYRIVFNDRSGFFSGNEVFAYPALYGGDVYVGEWLGNNLNQILEIANDEINGLRIRLMEHVGARTYTQRYAGSAPGLSTGFTDAKLEFVEDIDHDGRTDLAFTVSESGPSGITKTLHLVRNISQNGSLQFQHTGITFNVTGFAKVKLVDPFAIVGARVQVGPYSAVTNGDGRFTIREVPAGTFPITATRNGYAIVPLGGSTLNVGSGLPSLNLSATAAAPTATPTPGPIAFDAEKIRVGMLTSWDKSQGTLSIRLPVRNGETGADYAILGNKSCTLDLYGLPDASRLPQIPDARYRLASVSTMWGPQGWEMPIRASILKGSVAFIAAVRCSNTTTARFSSWVRFSTKSTRLKKSGAALTASAWLKKAKRVMKTGPA